MNASMNAMRAGATARDPAGWHEPRRAVSRELADAATALRGFIPADATLDDVRRALHGMGFAWTGAGELTYCPNARLLDEFDELIDAYGRDAPAALLFTAIDDKQAATWRSLPERADPGAVIFGHQHA